MAYFISSWNTYDVIRNGYELFIPNLVEAHVGVIS